MTKSKFKVGDKVYVNKKACVDYVKKHKYDVDTHWIDFYKSLLNKELEINSIETGIVTRIFTDKITKHYFHESELTTKKEVEFKKELKKIIKESK